MGEARRGRSVSPSILTGLRAASSLVPITMKLIRRARGTGHEKGGPYTVHSVEVYQVLLDGSSGPHAPPRKALPNNHYTDWSLDFQIADRLKIMVFTLLAT